ncbi:MAG TPA: carboxypeptidase regulatory-like domain-containing protein [Pyrinomonadaceae bacterium]|nr:carboxypeptidase regulatory-like domain-containing protein [Pyrinomonadaceae bacterium]
MIIRNRTLISLFVLLAVLTVPLIAVHSAGGRIEGRVTDPKGSAIADAAVTVTEDATNQTYNAVTDAQGRYKVEGLAAGSYTVVISAKGFSEVRKEAVKVVDDAAATVDIKLEIPAVEANVTVAASGLSKANSDPVYQQLRQQTKANEDFTGSYATVSNLVLKREGATFTLRNGQIYFVAPVEGRYTGGVFIGDGEFNLVPPTEVEKNSLKIFTNEPSITEQFSGLVLRFTDKTFDEIRSAPGTAMATSGPQAGSARDTFRENQTLLRKRLRDNFELKTLADLYAPERPGFFTAFINGKRFSKLVYIFSPLGIPEVSPEEVLLFSYGDTDGGFWTAFHRLDEYAKGTASSAEDHRVVDLVRHEIDGTIKGTTLAVVDKITFKALLPGRVVPLNLYRTLRVSKVLDDQSKEISFIQEGRDEDSDLGIIMPARMEAGKTYSIAVHYEGGDAIRDSGGGNFILVPRSTWYPNNAGTQFGDRAIFDMTFRYPKSFMFVGTGAPVAPDSREGDLAVAKWSSGTTDLAVAGFNYGRFKKKEIEDKEAGYTIEFYANPEVPDELRRVQNQIEQAEREGIQTFTTLGAISTTKMADSALADAQNSARIYNAFFGKLPYTRFAMTQQPAANFGQAWPTLVYMPYTAFMDVTQRTQLFGVRGGTSTFWRYVGPHEVAHQWWGHTIGWHSYHDQWMSEGFAELSASLYVQYVRRDHSKFTEFWEEQRHQIVDSSPATKGRKPYTVGPVTQGYRLNNAKTGNVAQNLIYPKGAYILHMIRMMMYSQKGGDAKFQAMMKDFVQKHYNKDVSTEDFKAAVEKHMTPDMDIDKNGRMDWFFNQWVYGTEMPSYRFEYGMSGDVLNGKITQSGVSNNFAMLVPLYADFGKGWIKLGAARLIGNASVDVNNLKLPMAPKKVAICALNDVLASNIQNGN